MVYCLVIDLIGSTETGLQMPQWRWDAFNRSLVDQLGPHLEPLGLQKAAVRFGGDGWLLFVDEVDSVPALCCLALVMAGTFQDDMAQRLTAEPDSIPPLRLAIAAGRDIRCVLPDGRTEWLGDSARRASRAAAYCAPNEVLVSASIHEACPRDFVYAAVDLAGRPPEQQPKRVEEELDLYVLSDVNAAAACDAEAPECFVYTLKALGRTTEAVEMVSAVSDCIAAEVAEPGADRMPAVGRWNRMLHFAPTHESAQGILADMRAAGARPTVGTYNALMSLAPSYDEAKTWLTVMRDEGIAPNVYTYSTLVSRAPSYDEAKTWLTTMRDEGIAPNVVTYSTLVSRAPSYDEAKTWLTVMRDEGIAPDLYTYNSLLSKDLTGVAAGHLLEWFWSEPYHPERALEAAIKSYRRAKLHDQALRICLHYPHLPAAKSLIRARPEQALACFESAIKADPRHPDADYALGVAFMELGRDEEARPHLVRALELTAIAKRQDAIRQWLADIDGRTARRKPGG